MKDTSYSRTIFKKFYQIIFENYHLIQTNVHTKREPKNVREKKKVFLNGVISYPGIKKVIFQELNVKSLNN